MKGDGGDLLANHEKKGIILSKLQHVLNFLTTFSLRNIFAFFLNFKHFMIFVKKVSYLNLIQFHRLSPSEKNEKIKLAGRKQNMKHSVAESIKHLGSLGT